MYKNSTKSAIDQIMTIMALRREIQAELDLLAALASLPEEDPWDNFEDSDTVVGIGCGTCREEFFGDTESPEFWEKDSGYSSWLEKVDSYPSDF